MEDCCAVCAEPLEWIGYGPCGHRQVCFTCIARLRFVLNDKHCCICKQDCPTVYITKALGDYTRVVTDWKSLQNHGNSSGKGKLYYDDVVEAYFDDEEPFKIIKSICRLSCSICEGKVGGKPMTKGMMKEVRTFKNLGALERHQHKFHEVSMCILCLVGRKVFICEQKLYSKSQLDEHFRNGDPEVDGNEEGFAGHPMCNFCCKAFYGDNELYLHMSQDHFTCHICQRARPGHHEYYRNYDDLEAHFRQAHSLCEDPECLAKKFCVFPGESELKRHNATTHGGNLSRSRRNAVLQIPMAFHYRRAGQDSAGENYGSSSSRRLGRAQGDHHRTLNGRDGQHGAAIQTNVESGNAENSESLGMSLRADESGRMETRRPVERPGSDDLECGISAIQRDTGSQRSRYRTAVQGAKPLPLCDEAFPPLAGTSVSARPRAKVKNKDPAIAAVVSRSRLMGKLLVDAHAAQLKKKSR